MRGNVLFREFPKRIYGQYTNIVGIYRNEPVSLSGRGKGLGGFPKLNALPA